MLLKVPLFYSQLSLQFGSFKRQDYFIVFFAICNMMFTFYEKVYHICYEITSDDSIQGRSLQKTWI